MHVAQSSIPNVEAVIVTAINLNTYIKYTYCNILCSRLLSNKRMNDALERRALERWNILFLHQRYDTNGNLYRFEIVSYVSSFLEYWRSLSALCRIYVRTKKRVTNLINPTCLMDQARPVKLESRRRFPL